MRKLHITRANPKLIALLLFLNGLVLHAQTFNVIHAFTGGQDGNSPYTGVLLFSTVLYGGTGSGGNGYGVLYSVNSDGTGFKVLHTVTNAADGSGPSQLVSAGDALYGTAQQAGPGFQGKIFSIIDYTNYNTLHNFVGTDGYYPLGQLVLSGSTLYGITEFGGSNNQGTIFKIDANGSGFTNLYHFSGAAGAIPAVGLMLSGNTLFGTCRIGGSANKGAVFAINTDGTGITNLHSFLGGNDGNTPNGRLALADGVLYGTTSSGGTNGWGNIFCVDTDGTGYKVLHSFAAMSNTGTNADGVSPQAGLIFYGDTLFGTARQGGAYQSGTLFMLRTNGENFTVLHHFKASTEGSYPECELAFDGNTLYGTVPNSGSNGHGAIFGYTIVPGIRDVQLLQSNIIINVSNGLSGHAYAVLMSTNLMLPLSQWQSIATNITVMSGNFSIMITNLVTPTMPRQFFRLQVQ